jgi:hypothetical protein
MIAGGERIGHVARCVLNLAATPEKVIQTATLGVVFDSEQDMNPRGLNVGIDNRDAVSRAGYGRSQAGRQVGFPGPSSKRMNGNDPAQETPPNLVEALSPPRSPPRPPTCVPSTRFRAALSKL